MLVLAAMTHLGARLRPGVGDAHVPDHDTAAIRASSGAPWDASAVMLQIMMFLTKPFAPGVRARPDLPRFLAGPARICSGAAAIHHTVALRAEPTG